MPVQHPTHYLIFVRHSAVQIDQDRSSHEWVLSADGRARCLPLAKSLSQYQPSLFVSSEEQKAIETAQIMSSALGIPQRSAPGLQEHNRAGTPYLNSNRGFRAAITEFFNHPGKLVFGQETAVDAFSRFNQAVFREIALHPHNSHANLTFVTHGTVLTLFVCHYNPQLDPIAFWNSLGMPCAVILNYPDLSFAAILSWNQ